MSLTRLALVSALMVCASSRLEAQKKSRCADTPIDSTNTAAPVYHDCHVDRKAKMRGSPPRSTFTPPTNGPSCYRAAFEFVIDTTGHVEMATIRRVSATDDAYGLATQSVIVGLLFEPARLDGSPVRQLGKYEAKATVSRVATPIAGGATTAGRSSRRPLC